MTDSVPGSAARHVRLTWIDADAPPLFDWTHEPVDGYAVFRTFTDAKQGALARFRDARRRIANAMGETQALTRDDVS